jgi:hypothetical protein
LDFIHAYARKEYMMIVNHSLTMITSCNKVVNLNYVVINITLALSEQLFCNWHMALMRMIMPHVQLGKGP